MKYFVLLEQKLLPSNPPFSILEVLTAVYRNYAICRSGEIGRHTGFRDQRGQLHPGSSPGFGTNKNKNLHIVYRSEK